MRGTLIGFLGTILCVYEGWSCIWDVGTTEYKHDNMTHFQKARHGYGVRVVKFICIYVYTMHMVLKYFNFLVLRHTLFYWV